MVCHLEGISPLREMLGVFKKKVQCRTFSGVKATTICKQKKAKTKNTPSKKKGNEKPKHVLRCGLDGLFFKFRDLYTIVELRLNLSQAFC